MCDPLQDKEKSSLNGTKFTRMHLLQENRMVRSFLTRRETMQCIVACIALLVVQSFAHESSRPTRRVVREVLKSFTCPEVRLSFPVRIDAMYLYTAVQDEASFDLKAIEHAIASSVSTALETCDVDGRPLQAVEIPDETRHEVVSFGTCVFAMFQESTHLIGE